MPAWKSHAGIVTLNPTQRAGSKETLLLPCGTCLGCRKAKAKGWALRCLLELHDHKQATFTTLTYDDVRVPNTLQKRDLQLFIKRLRRSLPTKSLRFFACGEYGEKNSRPHYHAILYGLSADKDNSRINLAWAQGITRTYAVTPSAIAYTAGYTAKKYLSPRQNSEEHINYSTGEIYKWQAPFLQMSRRNGIGSTAKQFTSSWRDFAILNGTRLPVPQYLHKAWEEIATTTEKEELEYEKYQRSVLTRHTLTEYRLKAQEQIAEAETNLQAEKRRL